MVQLADLLGHGSIDTTRIYLQKSYDEQKKNLIEALRGSYMFIDNLPELVNKESIYDENGCVDTELMTAILEWMSRVSDVTTQVGNALGNLLGIEDDEKKDDKKDEGIKWSVEEILRHCTLEDNVLKLPQVQFNKKSYAEAKKWIEEAGGSWQGGKVQGFTFPFNAERVFQYFAKVNGAIYSRIFSFCNTSRSCRLACNACRRCS